MSLFSSNETRDVEHASKLLDEPSTVSLADVRKSEVGRQLIEYLSARICRGKTEHPSKWLAFSRRYKDSQLHELVLDMSGASLDAMTSWPFTVLKFFFFSQRDLTPEEAWSLIYNFGGWSTLTTLERDTFDLYRSGYIQMTPAIQDFLLRMLVSSLLACMWHRFSPLGS